MLLLICSFKEDTCVLTVKTDDSLRSIHDRISNRWFELKHAHVNLYYAIHEKHKCMLFCDDDVRSMIALADSYGTNRVEVVVLEDGVIGSSSSYVVDQNHMDGPDALLPMLSSNNQSRKIDLGWDKILIKAGQRIEGGAVAFRECLQKLSIQTEFQFEYTKNHADRITANCAMKDQTKCQWKVHAVKEALTGLFHVTKLCNVHTCGTSARSFEDSRLGSKLVSKYIIDTIRDKPMTTPSDVKHLFFSQYSFKLSYDVARGAVKRARVDVFGDKRDSFNKLPSYVERVRQTNRDSVVFFEVDDESHRFKRMFIAYAACIQWFNFCRPLLYLDGAHLKNNIKGHLLAATGKNGDNGLYPLCYAVVESEDYENWRWFLVQLRGILSPDRNITFMTDRNSGLVDAIPEIFPDAYHSFCIYHLKLNMKNNFSGKRGGAHLRDHMVKLLHDCAYASTVEEFHQHMDDMLRHGGKLATSFFKGLQPENWANAYFKGCRYGNMATTAAESFNSWVLKERHLPVLNMVDVIRIKIMKQLSDRRTMCASWSTVICPKIDSTLYELMDIGRTFSVGSSSEHRYEVFSSPSASVDLECETCTCNEWQRYGYPCLHGLAVIGVAGFPLHQFVDRGYLTESYSNAYQSAIYPIPDSYLTENMLGQVDVLPPIPKRQPDRPRKKRIKSRGESTRPIICGSCNKEGNHNSRTCKVPLEM